MFEVIIAETLPELTLDSKPQVHKAQRTPSKIYTEKCTIGIP
jgi:hypothetical protein